MTRVSSCVPNLGITNDKESGIIALQEVKIISPFLAFIRIALETTACLVHSNGLTIFVEVPCNFRLWVSSSITEQHCLPYIGSLNYSFIA